MESRFLQAVNSLTPLLEHKHIWNNINLKNFS
jgi:hypothetical protein